MSPDAARILALPHARVPALTEFVRALAGCNHVGLGKSIRLIEAAMRDLKLTDLDVEMVQPGSDARAPFIPSGAGSDNHTAVAGHVHRMIGRQG